METMQFGPLTVRFDDRVLRPRPWTLAQSLWAAEMLDDLPPGPILEVCAGVGHIGLAVASLAARDLVLVDADAAACAHARHNVRTAGLPVRVEVRHGPMDAVVGADERFVLVLADPPWVPSGDTRLYPEDPLWAIDGGPDGLHLARACAEVAGRHLDDDGAAIVQLGTQAQAAALGDDVASRPALRLRLDEIREVPEANGVLAGFCRLPVQAADTPRPATSRASVRVSTTGTPTASSSLRGCEPPS